MKRLAETFTAPELCNKTKGLMRDTTAALSAELIHYSPVTVGCLKTEIEFLELILKDIFRVLATPHWVVAILSGALLSACSSTGIVPMDKGTYMISKKSPQVGFGPPVGIKGEVYAEANKHCAREGKAVETTKYEETNSGFARSAAVALEFKCIPK